MSPSVRERNNRLVWFTKHFSKLFLSPFFRIKTEGLHNVSKQSSFILTPKHQRWEDIPLLSISTPRSLYYIAKNELFLNPFSGWLLSSLGGLPLNRSRPLESRESFKIMMDHLKEGEGLVIFPEGTYFKDRVGPGRSGMVKMIRTRLKIPFIPVGINYTKEGRRTLVRIHFGKALYDEPSDTTKNFLDRIMKEIKRLSGF
jgi:1-acyl-sn-glycerol-3-phosphate acyltransferase